MKAFDVKFHEFLGCPAQGACGVQGVRLLDRGCPGVTHRGPTIVGFDIGRSGTFVVDNGGSSDEESLS